MAFEALFGFFQKILDSIPEDQKPLFSLIIYTVLIFIYSLFIWKFYRFLACREIIQLNLKQYNYSSHPGLEKFFAMGLYTIEYLIVLPFLVIFWFAILSIFLLVLSESQDTHQLLLVAAAIIASTRATSYVSEELSKDLAKILPFTVLATFILGDNFFNSEHLLIKLQQIPSIFSNILMFLIFIFIVEFFLRGVYSIVQLIRSDESDDAEEVPVVGS